MLRTYKRLQSLFDYLWLNWEPETIKEMLHRRGALDLDMDKVLAVQTYIMSDAFFVDRFAFEKIIVSSSGRTPDWSIFESVSPLEICLCVKQLKAIPEREYRDFEDDVLDYIIHIFKGSKVYKLPPSLFVDYQRDDAAEEMATALSKDQLLFAEETDITPLEEAVSV